MHWKLFAGVIAMGLLAGGAVSADQIWDFSITGQNETSTNMLAGTIDVKDGVNGVLHQGDIVSYDLTMTWLTGTLYSNIQEFKGLNPACQQDSCGMQIKNDQMLAYFTPSPDRSYVYDGVSMGMLIEQSAHAQGCCGWNTFTIGSTSFGINETVLATPAKAPELQAGGAAGALTLFGAGIIVANGNRRRHQSKVATNLFG